MSISPTPDGTTSTNNVQNLALKELVVEMISARNTRDRFPSEHADGLVYGTFRCLRALVFSIEDSRLPEPDLMSAARQLLAEESKR